VALRPCSLKMCSWTFDRKIQAVHSDFSLYVSLVQKGRVWENFTFFTLRWNIRVDRGNLNGSARLHTFACLSVCVCLSVLPWSLMLRLLRVTLEQHRSAASYFDDYYFARPRGKVPTPNSAEFPVHASCLWRSWLSPRLTTTQCVMYFRSVDDVIFSHNGVTMHRYH